MSCHYFITLLQCFCLLNFSDINRLNSPFRAPSRCHSFYRVFLNTSLMGQEIYMYLGRVPSLDLPDHPDPCHGVLLPLLQSRVNILRQKIRHFQQKTYEKGKRNICKLTFSQLLFSTKSAINRSINENSKNILPASMVSYRIQIPPHLQTKS